ncbi:MAG TPA: histidine kinase [Acidimicrobiales bacterium]|nr:histidine kinase [Acidimicrobiales bacterium]
MELASQLRAHLGSQTARMLTAARLAGLGVLLWAVANQRQSDVGGGRVAVPLLMAGAVVGWTGWMACRRFGAPEAATWGCLALLAATGGALAGFAPVAVAFVAVASLGAGIAFEPLPASAVGAIGVGAVALSVLAVGTPVPAEVVAEAALSAAAGLMAGTSRRQYLERAHQAELLLAERVRADAERDRAAALAERNRVGRELHDVLAHSLGALSVQLDAADAVLEQGEDPTKARRLVQQARRLAVQGLEETREAVRALRDEPVALAEQLEPLASRAGAELCVTGHPRALDPDAGLALYRAAQEAVTNAGKHAPGAPVSIHLDFGARSTTLVVSNGASPTGRPPTDLSSTGGGFGLQGMRERVALLGGQVMAAPSNDGWTVEVAVPA